MFWIGLVCWIDSLWVVGAVLWRLFLFVFWDVVGVLVGCLVVATFVVLGFSVWFGLLVLVSVAGGLFEFVLFVCLLYDGCWWWMVF